MHIVVTDGYTLNPGDLQWDALKNVGTVNIYDRTTPAEIIERCKHAEIVLTNKVPFTASTLQQLPKLRLISVLATGYNVIDVAAAKQQGITVCNVPAYGTASVAQHTIALLLELTNHVGLHSASVRQGEWETAQDWSYTKQPLIELAGKTMGLVGYGNIGRQTATIAAALGMKILFHTPAPKEDSLGNWCDLEFLFRNSDAISLHCPLTNSNQAFVHNKLLQQMKPSAFLINTARGQLINEKDLANALQEGVIAGAALDVLSTEPPASDNPLLRAKNCIITPHNAWMSREARQRIMDTTIQNIKSFMMGTPVHVV